MSELNQHLLAIIQDGFPLVERPYLHLAEMLNVSEQEAFDAVEMLRASGVIRRIGGVYDSKKLGFISRLCAGKMMTSSQDFSAESHEATAMEKFAVVVNEEPAITHNYIRSHEYNVWFTVISENEAAIESIVERICAKTELHDVHVLSATKKYKINTVMGGADAPVVSRQWLVNRIGGESLEARQSLAGALTESDRTRIRTACDDIPHSLTPFKDWGISCDELREDLASKRMRRFGAILRHQEAGFAFNAMVCFDLDERGGYQKPAESRHSDPGVLCTKGEESSKVLLLANKHYVSHCYERPSFEGFPYNLYAMMHAQTSAELDDYIKDAATLLGNPEYVVLHSVRELKKTSFKFFV
ncbi:Lrp/AsnC family transcriptional regulator [Fibrobacter sp.]|uniref:Lrp/AsnC family transcriptional regulator n=1 Tax=Fibrobacter sp. TaxID=35828 RepID=UPI0025BE8C01|nr:Lrp/AsnC family transcriptional regulator [Fibrobacter sp.]MBR3071590.1 Lrp/AsnC family transcriptional regulator [Fibrobacter sp.]